MRPYRVKGEQRTYTFASVAGIDYDDVLVSWELERPEPDVNFAGGVILNAVYVAVDKDMLDSMTEREQDDLAQRLLEGAYDYDSYGDYLYEQRKDYELEQRATAQSLAMDPDRRYK